MHFYVVKFSTLKKIFLLLLLFVVFSFNFSSEQAIAQVFLYNKTKKVPIYCVETSNKYVALTFDAAWGSDKTEKILNILKENEIEATFFLVGFWVDKNEDLVNKINDQGLEIGTHSNTHPNLTTLNLNQINLELKTSKEKIEKITNKEVKVFRAPFGAYNDNVLTVAENNNLKTIQWDVDSLDWKGISSEQIILNILKKVKNGSIILCHNNSDYIVEALPNLILSLKSRGYSFKKVSSLIYQDNYKIDNSGKQIKNT